MACGKILGHGEICVEGYECGQCSKIKELEEQLRGQTDNGSVIISKEEYALFQKLTKIWYHTEPEKTGSFFICGEAGDSDEHGLPEYILVCPQMGANETAVYKKEMVGKSGQ